MLSLWALGTTLMNVEQVLQEQTQIEQKEGRQEEHSRLDGWGQPDQET